MQVYDGCSIQYVNYSVFKWSQGCLIGKQKIYYKYLIGIYQVWILGIEIDNSMMDDSDGNHFLTRKGHIREIKLD